MPKSWMIRQGEEVAKRISKADIVISTALIPGKKAPILITSKMVKSMRAGSVIVDMAVEQGGNCEGSEVNQTVVVDGVRIIGFTNLPAKLPTDASSLYSRNMLDFLKLIINDENKLHIPDDDDIVSATLVVKEGKIWN